jgi:hypothetical protein
MNIREGLIWAYRMILNRDPGDAGEARGWIRPV